MADARFLEAFLLSDEAWKAIDAMKTGVSDSGLNLTHGRFLQLAVPVAPLAEQLRIVEAIEAHFTQLDAAVAVLERVRANLKRYRASVLSNAFDSLSAPNLRLEQVAEDIQYGLTASAEVRPSGPRFLRITDIQENHVDWASVPSCDIDDAAIEKYRLNDGDLVFARTGATTGKSYLVRNPPEAVFASYLIRVKPGPSVRAKFLWHFFQSPGYWTQVNEKKQGMAQPNVNGSKLAQLELPVPDLRNQDEIILEVDSRLSVADSMVAEVDAARAKCARMRQAILKKAFEGRLVPQDPRDEPANVMLDRTKAPAPASPTGRRGRTRKGAPS